MGLYSSQYLFRIPFNPTQACYHVGCHTMKYGTILLAFRRVQYFHLQSAKMNQANNKQERQNNWVYGLYPSPGILNN
jgi:hypothetical protein